MFIAAILIGLIPLMLGLIFELVIVMPIRVPLEMTPVFFPWQVSCHSVLKVSDTV